MYGYWDKMANFSSQIEQVLEISTHSEVFSWGIETQPASKQISDDIFFVNAIIEKPDYACFVDFTKAFDIIDSKVDRTLRRGTTKHILQW